MSTSPARHADTVITVDQLAKTYGNHHAVSDVSFTVQRGTIVGIPRPQRRRQDHDAPHAARARGTNIR